MHVSDSHKPAVPEIGDRRDVAEARVTHGERQQPQLEDEIDFSYYSQTLLRHWKLLVAGAVLGAIAGLASASSKPTLYQAATTVLVSQASSQASIATSRALLANNTLAAQTLEETGLSKPPFNMTPQAFVGGALRIDEVPGTSLVRVAVTLPDPKKAAEASTILSRKAVELNTRIASAESASVRGQLQAHLDDASVRFKEAEDRLLKYRNEAQVEVLKKDTDAMLDERGGLLKLLIEIEAEKGRLTAAEQEIRKQERVLSVPRSVGSEEALRQAAKALTPPDETTLADPNSLDLSGPFINPVYQTLAFQIANSRTRLAGLERQRREMVVVRKLGDSQFSQLSDLHQRELELAKLQGAYALAGRVLSDLALRYEQSRTESVNRMVQLQVVDEAIPPDQALPKKRGQSTGMGMMAGLALAGVVALAWGSGAKTSDAARSV